MSNQVAFITTEREHLFAVSRLLMTAIEPALLQDKDRPVTVSVRGSYAGGKKIFPDAAKEALLGSAASLEGVKEYDELWTGERDGKPLEVDFINVAWGNGYHKDFSPSGDEDTIIAEFLKERKAGGVTFVHNDNKFGSSKASIDIVLEQAGVDPVTYNRFKIKSAGSGIRREFNELADAKEWARFVQITVRDPRLLEGSAFRKAFESLAIPRKSNGIPVIGKFIDRLSERFGWNRVSVPVYGVNVLREPSLA